MILYKIRNKEGLFSCGGTNVSFTKQGKSWKRRGDLASHLNIVRVERARGHGYGYTDCEIVVFELVETGILKVSPEEWLHANEKKKQDERKVFEDRRSVESQKKRYEDYEQLKKEFD